jgi:hypothetical protein
MLGEWSEEEEGEAEEKRKMNESIGKSDDYSGTLEKCFVMLFK